MAEGHPELRLDSLAFGGDAVGRLDGKVVFVPFGAPGDAVRIDITRERTRYVHAEIREIIHGSEHRREPPCSLFGRCGGCHWQHLNYACQLAQKGEIFERQMVRAGVESIDPPVMAAAEFGYRRRVRMRWSVEGHRVQLGFFRRGSRDLVDVPACALLVPPLQLAIDHLRAALEEATAGEGTLAAVAGHDGAVHVSVRPSRRMGAEPARELVGHLVARRAIEGGLVEFHDRPEPFGAPSVNVRPDGEPELHASGATFVQANASVDEELRRLIRAWLSGRGKRILELHAGVGNLTRDISDGAREVIAVDSSRASFEMFQENKLSTDTSQMVRLDAARAVTMMVGRGEAFDVAILDPPRQGCADVCKVLPELLAETILYISCDPMTLTRDILALGRRGYRPVRARMLDMMPQTYHLEGVVLLERRPNACSS